MSRYTPTDKMSTLISENFQLLQVLSRFGIALGFGDDSVEKICRDNNVDSHTFLTVVNFVVDGELSQEQTSGISLQALLHYLRQSHVYFLEFLLPAIRKKLLEGIQLRTNDVSFLIIKFFDDYVREVATHMQFEEETIFRHVNNIITSTSPDDYNIITYSDHHEEVSSKLKELKNLIIRYCPESADANLLNDALYDIFRCEQELESHCQIEDLMLLPAISKYDRGIVGNK